MPWRKLLVPSSGSTMTRGLPASPGSSPPSSMRKPQSGRATRNSSHKVRSATWSALETKSAGPLRLTCRCSTSPKSRRKRLPALRAARSITRINPETMATGGFPSSVEREANRLRRNLHLAPAAREREPLSVAGNRIDDAVIVDILAGLVDLQVLDIREPDVAPVKAPLFTLLRRFVVRVQLGQAEVHLERQRLIVVDHAGEEAVLEIDPFEARVADAAHL